MSRKLEDFIRQNREDFDCIEPSMGLWKKIEQKLELPQKNEAAKQARTFSLNFVLKVAASIIIVMGVCFVWYLQSSKTAAINLADINPAYAKQQMHYASLVETKRTELKEVAKADPQLYNEFSREIAKMDSAYSRLKKDLATSPNQERTLRAMIRNLQIQTEVLNQQLNVIEEFNEFKKEQHQQKNEIKNI